MPKGTSSISELLQRLADIQLEEQRIINQLITATQETTDNVNRKIAVGSRVRIRNHITGRRNKPVTDEDRIGTVTKITKSRILLTTDSGIKTWRIAKNLELL